MMRLLKDKKAVSPVVGVILMVAITIVLAATIYVWVAGMSSPAATAPSINLRGTFSSDGSTLTLTVVSVQGDAKWSDLQVTVSDGSANYPTTGLVKAGDQITITGYSGTEITVQIVHVPSNSIIYEDTFLVP